MALQKKRPNILWIMTDQHKSNMLSCMWQSLADSPYSCTQRNLTPNLDQLAEDGMLFTNTYCPSPVCGPARVSLKTGMFPPANGAVENWLAIREDNVYLPQLLKDSGYETAMAGKLHFFPPDRDYGFCEQHLSDAPYSVYWEDDKHSEYIKWLRENYFDKKEQDPVELFNEDEESYDQDLKRFIMGSRFRTNEEHETRWTTDRTLEFLDRYDGSRPFFYYTSYFGPHQPYGVDEPYASFCKPEEVRLPDSYYTDYKKGCPVFEEKCRQKYAHVRTSLTETDCRELVAAYVGQVHMIDESIGQIIRRLKEKGLYDNTVIIFTSDHGDHLGEHGLFFKCDMYDSCAKVPLIIKPAHTCTEHRRNEVVNTLDLFQTILDIAQTDWHPTGRTAENIESRSLLPLLDKQDQEWNNTTFSIIGQKKDSALCMLRTGDWKLIRSAHGEPDAVYELYNLALDPQEIHNRYDDPNCIKIRESMRSMLDSWFHKQYKNYSELEVLNSKP